MKRKVSVIVRASLREPEKCTKHKSTTSKSTYLCLGKYTIDPLTTVKEQTDIYCPNGVEPATTVFELRNALKRDYT